jgi:hypothetical protein
VTKQREYATDGTLAFTLRQVTIGVDSDGDPVSSCIVEPSDGEPTTKKRLPKLTGAPAVGLAQLRNCINSDAAILPASNHIPTGAKGVTLALWRTHLEKAGVINPDGNPREQFRRIRVTLQDRGFIGVWGDHVWLSHAVTSASQ